MELYDAAINGYPVPRFEPGWNFSVNIQSFRSVGIIIGMACRFLHEKTVLTNRGDGNLLKGNSFTFIRASAFRALDVVDSKGAVVFLPAGGRQATGYRQRRGDQALDPEPDRG